MRLGFSLRCRLATILPVALAVTVVFAHSEQIKDIHPTGYVTDLADVLSAESKSRLEVLATELQQKTDVQLAVVTVNSLEGQSVDDYAVDLYKHLGVGFKGTDRGVLILVAPKDRKYRVEVGYGLEPVINDARAGDVGRAMVPLLRRGDYDGAIEAAAWQLAQYVAADRGVTLSGQRPERHLAQHQEQEPSVKVFTIILVALFLLFLMNAFRNRGSGNRRMGPRGGGWWIGPMMGGGRGWGGGGFGGGGGGFSGGGGFGGFGGGSSGGGGASGSW